jgi:hypothetical protein
MNVRPSTRLRAVLDIFAAHRKPRGGSLSLQELERDWRDTGLRRSDLDAALRGMTQRHLLQLQSAGRSARYELTYLGECAMQLPLAGGTVSMIRDWLTLRRAKRRHLRATPTDSAYRNRRANDQPQAENARDSEQRSTTGRLLPH